MRNYFVAGLVFFSLFLASCTGQYNKAESGAAMGAIGGAVVGQAIGGNTGGTVIGALVGGAVGYMVGNEMDKYDRQQLNHAYEYGVSGRASSWRNPDNGNSYAVTPEPAYSSSEGTCRRANVKAVIDGRVENTYTTACRDSEGQWKLQN